MIKSLLNDGYLVTFYIDSSCAWYSSSDLILSYDEYNGAAPCHANVIVGYDDSITDTDAGDSSAFRVANSWGAGFKDGGFYWITYDTMSKIRSNSPVANYYLPRDYGRPYEPLVLGTWTLDPVGTLDGAEVTVGIGSPESPLATTRPSEYWSAGKHSKIPNFMCIDLTEFKGHIDAGADEFFLAMGRGSSAAMITSFSIEIYSAYSDPPIETYSSDEVPAWTPATVAISDRPSVLFSWSPYAPLTFEPVQFTDNSSSKGGTIVSWYWSFGDGVQSGLRSPVHSYSLHGEFIVSLTVTDNNGLSFTRSQTITVQNRIPSVEILSTIGGGYYSGVLELVANASDLDDGIRKVDFFYCVDDQSYFIGSNSSGSATALWRFSWNTSPLTISDVQICAVAFDGYDYSPQSYLPSTINLDNAPPCIPAIRSPRSALRTDAEAIFSWYPAVDAGSGVAKYLIEICGSPDFRSNDLQLMESQEVSCKGALAPGLWYWRVRAIDRAGNMGEWSETRYLIADSFLVNESGFSLSRADIGSSQSVWFKIVYQYDGSPFTGMNGTAHINGTEAIWNDANQRWELQVSELISGEYTFRISSIQDYDDPITTVCWNAAPASIVFDRVIITEITPHEIRVGVGKSVLLNASGIYEYDSQRWVGGFVLNDTNKKDSIGRYYYSVADITDELNGLTEFVQYSQPASVVFDNIVVNKTYDTRLPGECRVEAALSFQYDGSPVLGAVVDINGQRAVEIGGGKYAAAVSTLVPYSVVSTSVGVPYFDTVAVEEGVFFVGNTVVYGVLLISCVIAVLYIYRHKGKNAYTTGETKFLLSRPDYALP